MVSLGTSTPSLKGKPHYRRTQRVYAVLNSSPPDATYDRLIEYVRVQTGKGCSRKLISKWKKTFSVSSDQLSVISKLTKNSQGKLNSQHNSDSNNTNVSSTLISSEGKSLDSNFIQPISEINQIEPDAIQRVELLKSQANASIIAQEDKPDITHQILQLAEEETTDILPTGNATKESTNQELLERSLTNNDNNDSLLNSDNDLSPTRYKEKTGHCSLITDHCKAWSYVAATAIVVGIAGCGWFFSKDNSQSVIAQPATVTQTAPTPRTQKLEPRTIKIHLTLSSPQDLKVKPGDEVISGTVLSDRTTERQRLLAQKKQLEISLKKLDLPIPEITQPKPIPALSKLPPVSYQQEEANIALKQQELDEAERAIANQQTKNKEIEAIQNSEFKIQNTSPDIESKLMQSQEKINSEFLPLDTQQSSINTSINNSNSIQNREVQNQDTANRSLINVIEHEKVVLEKLIAAQDKAKLQLDIAKSKLITAKEQRAHAEYQRYLEETKRAIALQQQQIELERQRSIRAGQIQEREYSKAQIETKIQEIDNAIAQLSTVKAPYAGKVKKVKWTGQDNHNLTVTLTLDVDDGSEQSTVTSEQ